jgi:hypothetical protein
MKLHDDVGVTFVVFLLLNDELPPSPTINWLLRGNQERFDPLRSIELEL